MQLNGISKMNSTKTDSNTQEPVLNINPTYQEVVDDIY